MGGEASGGGGALKSSTPEDAPSLSGPVLPSEKWIRKREEKTGLISNVLPNYQGKEKKVIPWSDEPASSELSWNEKKT